jgi:hypothetical protein
MIFVSGISLESANNGICRGVTTLAAAAVYILRGINGGTRVLVFKSKYDAVQQYFVEHASALRSLD